MVCLVHAALTAIVVAGLRSDQKWWAIGYLSAAALHALANLGALLYQLGLISDVVEQLSLLASVALLVIVFERLRRSAARKPSAAAATETVTYFVHQ